MNPPTNYLAWRVDPCNRGLGHTVRHDNIKSKTVFVLFKYAGCDRSSNFYVVSVVSANPNRSPWIQFKLAA